MVRKRKNDDKTLIIFYVILSLLILIVLINLIIDIKKGQSITKSQTDTNNTTEESASDDTDEKEISNALRVVYSLGALAAVYPNETAYDENYEGISLLEYPYSVAGVHSVAFASYVSDFIYGKNASASYGEGFENIRIGDQIRTENDTHTAIVIYKAETYVIVVECNLYDGAYRVEWGRRINMENLSKVWYIRRTLG